MEELESTTESLSTVSESEPSSSQAPSTPAVLLDLPNELLLLVALQFYYHSDLNALARTSRFFYALLNNELYRYNALEFSSSALCYAVRFSRTDTATKALQNGANPNTISCADCRRAVAESGPFWTLRTDAASLECPILNVCYGRFWINRHRPQSVLQCAVRMGSVDMVELLLLYGASPLTRYPDGYCSNQPLVLASIFGHHACVKLLLDFTPDIAAMCPSSDLALAYSLEQGHVDVIRLLLTKAEARLQRLRPYHVSLLSSAIFRGHIGAVKLVLENGVVRDESQSSLNTLLRSAVTTHAGELVELLLDLGADIYARYARDYTAMWYVAGTGDLDTCRRFINKGFEPENEVYMSLDLPLENLPIHAAVVNNRLEIAGLLFSRRRSGIDSNPWRGSHCLRDAAYLGHLEMVRLLMNQGAILHRKDLGGRTALFLAAMRGHIAIVQLLLEAGASADHVNKELQTPLWPAIVYGHMKIAELIADATSNRYCRDKSGHTPIMVAERSNQPAIALILLKRGFDPFETPPFTPLATSSLP